MTSAAASIAQQHVQEQLHSQQQQQLLSTAGGAALPATGVPSSSTPGVSSSSTGPAGAMPAVPVWGVTAALGEEHAATWVELEQVLFAQQLILFAPAAVPSRKHVPLLQVSE